MKSAYNLWNNEESFLEYSLKINNFQRKLDYVILLLKNTEFKNGIIDDSNLENVIIFRNDNKVSFRKPANNIVSIGFNNGDIKYISKKNIVYHSSILL